MGEKCKLCNSTIDYSGDFEAHILTDHMMSYSKYYEYSKLIGSVKCDICNEDVYRISPWFEVYNPCISCSSQRMYFESVLMGINKIHDIICNNRYSKLFILDKSLRERMIEFDIPKYCRSLSKIRSNSNDDINLFKISTYDGRSPYLDPSMSNAKISKSSYDISKKDMIMCNNESFSLRIHDDVYTIYLPEECEYHNNNHYKYNILNRQNNPQSAKKLLLSSGTCIKFYNTNFDRCKSLLRVSKNGNNIYSVSLSMDELDYIKYYIMSNTSLLRYLFNVLYELIRNSDTVYDYAFLLNKVVVNPSGKFNMMIDWTINNMMLNSDKDILNISIL